MNTHVRALGALIDDLFDLTRLQAQEIAVDDGPGRGRGARGTMPSRRCGRPPMPAPWPCGPSCGRRSAASTGNEEQLRRVLFNLIQNAIRHTPPDGSVTVQAEDVDGGVEIEVADTGTGIAPEQRDRVFDPFYRGDAARQSPGAGLGLAIARAIVEAHGGAIWLEDAPPAPALPTRPSCPPRGPWPPREAATGMLQRTPYLMRISTCAGRVGCARDRKSRTTVMSAEAAPQGVEGTSAGRDDRRVTARTGQQPVAITRERPGAPRGGARYARREDRRVTLR